MYRHVDAAVVRAAALGPDRHVVWPDLTGSAAAADAAWRTWLQEVWRTDGFADAVEAASPDLAARVERICACDSSPASAPFRRTVLAVMRYLLRSQTRATPFGLFAGVATARIGARAALRIGAEHQAVVRPDAAATSDLVDEFEARPEVRPRLMLLASNLAVERDGHLVIEHRPSSTGDRAPEQVRIRLTEPLREAMSSARTPIRWADLEARLAAAFPTARTDAINGLLAGLVTQRCLITSVRPAMTITDPLEPLLQLRPRLTPAETSQLREVPRRAVDLRIDWDLVLPEAVARETAAAAEALVRLAPREALAGWPEWHSRFLERYGPRAVVPVLDAIDTLGYPPGYLGSTTVPQPTPLPERDSRLIKLAHAAAMRREREVELNDSTIAELTTTALDHPVQPSTEITVRIHAESEQALHRGEFTLHVVGAARSAGSTTGRFLHVLDAEDRSRMATVYGGLPGVHRDALVAQISSAPLYARAENVARAPQTTDLVIALGEYYDSQTRTIPVTDLAVTADAAQLHLLSLSRHRRPVHTLLLNAVDFGHHTHPLARFLAEAPVALAVPCTGFTWGSAASHLPFLPALRYGRTILSPARWIISGDDLPDTSRPWPQWDEALAQWRDHIHLPERVYLSEADQRLALNLAEPSHRALLRTHLDRQGKVALSPAPEPGDLGWTGGRAHEVVLPMAAVDQAVAPVQTAGQAPTREHAHLPGCDDRVYLQLHGRRDCQDALLTRHIPALLDELGDSSWWFVRYGTPADHLRIRLSCEPGTVGSVIERAGEWSRRLRRCGLITHAGVETYHPETARFGGPASVRAAEEFFAADSAAVLAQLTVQVGEDTPHACAVTAASMVDIATGLLGDEAEAMRWLIKHTRTDSTAPPRAVYRQTVDLVNTAPDGLDTRLTKRWSERRAALAAYRQALKKTELQPNDVLADLLHLHHVRVWGVGLAQERAHLHLARAAALSWISRRGRTT